MATQQERARALADLHRRPGTFIIPNPWDVGSARILAALGFEALATTSSGGANALGRPDGGLSRNEALAHCRRIAAATPLPVSADLENGFADDPAEAAETVVAAAAAGVVGGSIEDYGGPDRGIYDFDHAVERVRATVEAVRSVGFPFTLTARAENLIRGRNDLDDTIRRLQAFEAAGADVLYAPGLTSLDQVRTVCGAVGRPVNVLAPMVTGASLAELADAGAKRLSVGGALARVATTAFLGASTEMREHGTFAWTSDLVPGSEVERLLAAAALPPSGGGAEPSRPAPPAAGDAPDRAHLNHAQARSIRATFTQVSDLLEGVLRVARGDASVFERQQADISAEEADQLVDLVGSIRAGMVEALVELGIPKPEADGSARWTARTAFSFAEMALAELTPQDLRGYGPVDAPTGHAVVDVSADLRRLVARSHDLLG